MISCWNVSVFRYFLQLYLPSTNRLWNSGTTFFSFITTKTKRTLNLEVIFENIFSTFVKYFIYDCLLQINSDLRLHFYEINILTFWSSQFKRRQISWHRISNSSEICSLKHFIFSKKWVGLKSHLNNDNS